MRWVPELVPSLGDQIKAKDTGHSRPSFKDDGLFDFDVNEFYKTVRVV